MVVLLLTLLCSCDTSRLYEKNIPIEANTWKAYHAYTFDFRIDNIEQRYNILFNLRNTPRYPNHNIYVRYELTDSVGNKLKTDLKNFLLFDPKTGDPLGDSGLGDLFDHQLPLLDTFSFPYKGNYTVALEQFMRYENLPEVNATGIRVEFAD